MLIFARLLCLLLLADAACYTLAVQGTISKELAGRIPDAIDVSSLHTLRLGPWPLRTRKPS
eukprot:5960445-Prymnesium_polylepis.1